MLGGGLSGGGDFGDRLKTCCFLSRLTGACWHGCKQVEVLAYVG